LVLPAMYGIMEDIGFVKLKSKVADQEVEAQVAA